MSAPRFADVAPVATVASILDALAAQGAKLSGVADDSRRVRPGDLFVAFPGAWRYIPDAIRRRAAAVLWPSGGDFVWPDGVDGTDDWRLPNLGCPDPRALCGPLAHAVFGHPGERLSLIAVTGTNGKTSVSQWIARLHPRRAAVIGTLGAGFPGEEAETGFTTPEAATLARHLADFAAAGAQACALEASSIGIEEKRLDGARIDVAVFTNLTRDHLDYHGAMENYAAAKEKLFHWPQLRLAVVNLDDPFGQKIAEHSPASRVLGYTQQEGAFTDRQGIVRAEAVEETSGGLAFLLVTPNGRARVTTRLMGRFNVANLLAVAAVLFDAGLSTVEIARRFSSLDAPPGRMEALGETDAPLVVVDYAHTPDALANALAALRGVAASRGGRLIALFGCGGERDRGKRPLMGAVAARLADRVVLTSDNPRGENPAAILAEIAAAAPEADIREERAAAIYQTLMAAEASDVLLIAGKGHEAYQEIGGEKRPFSDAAEAKAALAAWREKKG